MPWTLLILVAGLVLRFGIEGYNTLGDILIVSGLVVTLVGWLIIGAILGKMKL